VEKLIEVILVGVVVLVAGLGIIVNVRKGRKTKNSVNQFTSTNTTTTTISTESKTTLTESHINN
jgi:hypothetical protein